MLRSDGPWKDEVLALGGADLVLDPVGGERFTDSLRSLRSGGRVVVVGFTEGSIPTVKVNRLLLANTEIVGAGWGAHLFGHLDYFDEAAAALAPLVACGRIAPIVGAAFPLRAARPRPSSCSTSAAPPARSSSTSVSAPASHVCR